MDRQTDEEKREAEILSTQKSLVVSFLNKGLPSLALKELRGLIDKYPQDADFHNLLGLTNLALRNPKVAVKNFSDAMRLKPKTSVALNLSSAHIEAGEFDKAIKVLMTTDQIDDANLYPHPERISHNIALAYERTNQVRRAERYYKKALTANPNFYISLMRLGQLYEKTKRVKAARSRYQKAAASCTICFDPVNALSMSYISSGQPRRAVSLLQDYLSKKDLLPQDRNRASRLIDRVKQIEVSRKRSNG